MSSERLPRDPILRAVMGGKAEPDGFAARFIHLRVHSAYSLLEGALTVAKVVAHTVAAESPAIAITDTNNLFGALEFANKTTKEGIQPYRAANSTSTSRYSRRGEPTRPST